MSGFEVAGLVLGAIPIALELLKHYEDAAKRLGYWRKIQVEYQQCKGELELQALLFKKNLRKLLLPLDIPNAQIDALLANPNGPTWKDSSVEARLESRLQDTYRHYLEYVKRLEQTMERLKAILALDSVGIQDHLGKTRDPWTLKALKAKVLDSEWWGYGKYRIRFANNAKDRHQLLEDLDKYNNKLEKLLRTSDEDTRLVMDREHTIADNKLCSFWIQATQTYTALSSHWDCGCESQAHHTVRVSLEHPQAAHDLKLAWSETQQHRCGTSYLQISKADSLVYAQETTVMHQPDPQNKSQPKKSAMKRTGQNVRQGLNDLRVSSYQCSTPGNCPIALEDLLRSQSGQPPSFRQRCRISLAVASSFMQLLETPWMPPKTRRPEIVFAADEQYYSPELVLEYSTLLRGDTTIARSKPPTYEFFGPMEFLGVLLLEFCFWSLLEALPLRASFPTPNTEIEKLAFDLAAAQSWRTKVLEHSGLDYKKAIDWCFQGHKDISSASWRKDMFRNVIQPLEQCYKYLSG
ncbi:hypothetical protein PG993_012572 [Apiospora rasikravindrae]|uniref:DUF7580 domain-containing protein n=1 Tax=Apiospora rasikravindrae TaxID=990691 RepID=A0ABR1S2Q6_9PEZI